MRFFTFLLLLFTLNSLKAQLELDWVYKIEDEAKLSISPMAVDHENNLISTGFFNGTIDFDQGPDTLELRSNINGSNYILKTDTSGKPIWVAKIDFTIGDVVVDSSNNVLITGIFNKDTVDFDLGDSVQNVLSPTSNISGYVAAYDKDLKLMWVNIYAKLNTHFGYNTRGKIRVNSKGDILWSGVYRDTIDFDPDTGVFNLFPDRYGSTFLAKMSSSGKLIWAKKLGFSIEEIEIDKKDNLIFGGRCGDSTDFNLDSSSLTATSNAFNRTPYLAMYDDQEELLWANKFYISSTEGGNFIRSISIDDLSNVYIGGGYPDSIAFPVDSNTWLGLKSVVRHDSRGDERNGYIAKFDSNGKAQWAKNYSKSTGGLFLQTTIAESIKLDKYGQVHTIGFHGLDTLFIRKYNTEGQIISIDSINNLRWTTFGFSNLLVDEHFGTYIFGLYYDGIVDFDPGPGTHYDTALWSKTFLARLKSKPIPVGIDKSLKGQNDVSIYPNPTTGSFLVRNSHNEPLDITIYNLRGQIVSRRLNHQGPIHTKLDKGLYLIAVTEKDGKTSILKLIAH